MGTYYDLLGLKPKATETEIRSAYARDMLGLQKSVAPETERFRAALEEAFGTLIDAQRRSAYDTDLRNAKKKPKRVKPAKVPDPPKEQLPKAARAPDEPKTSPAPKVAPAAKATPAKTKPARAATTAIPMDAARRAWRHIKPARVPKPPKEQLPKAARAPDEPKASPAPKVTPAAKATPTKTKPAKAAANTAVPVDPARRAWRHARGGSVVFALGGLLSGIAYVYANAVYLLAWAPLLVGGVGLGWGVAHYLKVPTAARRPDQILLLGGLILFGLVSAGWVGVIGTAP